MKYSVLIFLIFVSFQAAAQNFSGGFSFNMPPYDSSQQKFLPPFPKRELPQEFITADSEGNFVAGDSIIRFWGNNLVADGAFPDKENAPGIAARMRKMGFNLVRFHHIDNPWAAGSLFHNVNGTRSFNQTNHDKLEYLIYSLKEQGIYINMNLHVSRTFETADGVPEADSLSDFGKGVTIFDTTLIRLQKEYAKDILTKVNPYTGLSLANDPVMAMVELVNENSLIRMWRQGDLVHIKDGGKLPFRHNRMLDSLWNNFLEEKYGNTDKLDSAWAVGADPVTADPVVLSDNFGTDLSSHWQLEEQEGADGSLHYDQEEGRSAPGALRVEVDNLTSTSWHFQLKHSGTSVAVDSFYRVSFSVKTDKPQNLSFSAMRDNDPWTWYAGGSQEIDEQWREVSFSFVAPEDNNGNLRISYNFSETASVWFDDFKIEKQVVKGLPEGENLEDSNVKRIRFEDRSEASENRIADQVAFYVHLHKDFYEEMTSYLKNTLGVKVPVSGTNWFVGPEDLKHQEGLDYVDNHAYWDHPAFPNEPWDPQDWQINNEPMLEDENGGTIANLFSAYQLKGKPYTISEYNHSFPGIWQAELMPVISAYSSFHGVDGIMFFNYNGNGDFGKDKLESYFDIDRNPLLMSTSPVYAYIYRNGLVQEAGSAQEISMTAHDVYALPRNLNNQWHNSFPYPVLNSLSEKYMFTSLDAEVTTPLSDVPAIAGGPYKTTSGEITWSITDGTFRVNSGEFEAVTGNFSDGLAAGNLELTKGEGFGSVSWLALDTTELADSRRSLLTLVSRVQNSGMVWDGTTTVHDNWGTSPVLLQPLEPKLTLRMNADSIMVYPLDEKGGETTSFWVKPVAQKKFTFTLEQESLETVWFGVEAYGDGTAPVTTAIHEEKGKNQLRIYPNPASQKISVPLEGEKVIRLFSASGTEVLKKEGPSKQIDISVLESGYYILVVEQAGRTYRTELIVE